MYTITLKQSVMILKTNGTISQACPYTLLFIRNEGQVCTEIYKVTKPCSNFATKACI